MELAIFFFDKIHVIVQNLASLKGLPELLQRY